MMSAPDRIGPYRVLSVLGEGGMGTVYLAEQEKPVQRRVALKVIKLGMDSTMVLRRFEAERQALAMMEHGNIARVFEASTTDRGQPYFAMEYVKGRPIAEYCDSQNLSLDERLRLFCQVCAGVQHAHQKGVIHRDLTPGNVLVTVEDVEPIPKIIDFGIARATEHRLIEATLYTEKGQIIGTPEYMSPEQAGLGELDIDTRSDIYTLGVLLYGLLAGELPFSSTELQEAGLSEMERKIREVDPPRPSTRLIVSRGNTERIASLRGTDARRLIHRLEGDLDWIVMKALEKDRTRRYQSAIELAEDIGRHLADEPVLASPPGLGYRTGKFIKRYRRQVIAAAAVLVTLLAGIAGTTHFRITAEANEAQANLLAQGAALRQAQLEVDELFRHPSWPDQIAPMEQWLQRAPDSDDLEALIRERDRLRDPSSGNGGGSNEANTLEAVIVELTAFVNGDRAVIPKRLDWAKQIEGLTHRHPDPRLVTWAEAREAIAKADGLVASTLYGADRSPAHPIDLEPQMGLVPLGMNPKTLLWEFYHLGSAKNPSVLPERNAETGEFEVTEDKGIIFVLVPGGTFTMGAQTLDPTADNYDKDAQPNEVLREGVPVEPFFLAKHELTQAQWITLSPNKENPSHFHPGRDDRVTLAHPAENMSWDMGHELLMAHGLRMPDGEEWEYACRAGSTTPYWSGNTIEDLKGYAHTWETPLAGYTRGDGRPNMHIPVSRLLPNGWGFFNMPGNVIEWCDDPHDDPSGRLSMQVFRGGNWFPFAREWARSSFFQLSLPDLRAQHSGMRAARDVMQ